MLSIAFSGDQWMRMSDRLLWILMLVFSYTLPFFPFISTRLLVLLLTISMLRKFNKKRLVEIAKQSWDVYLFLLILVVGITYSKNIFGGLKVLETSFALFALPIVFYQLGEYSSSRQKGILVAFSSGTFFAGLVCTVHSLFVFLSNGGGVDSLFFYNFTEVIDSHPTYFAYFIICSITFGLYEIAFGKYGVHRRLLVVLVTGCFGFLVLTGGRTAFIGLLYVFAFFMLRSLMDYALKSKGWQMFIASFSMLLIMFFVSSTDIGDRRQVLNDSWDRSDLWQSALDANSNYLIGVGTADYKEVLNEYYRKHDQSAYANKEMNAHNQFIQTFLSNGMVGFIAVCILLLRPILLAFRRNDQFGILLLFPFLIYGMTEVFLGRYQGVVFFAMVRQSVLASYFSTNGLFGSTSFLVKRQPNHAEF